MDYGQQKPIVWLVQRRDMNVPESIYEVGEPVEVIPDNVKPWEPANAIPYIQKMMQSYDPRTHSILMIGAAVFTSMVAIAAAAEAYGSGLGHLRVAVFRGRDETYKTQRIPLDGLFPVQED